MKFFSNILPKKCSTILTLLSLLVLQQEVLAAEYPYTYRSFMYLGRGDTGIADTDNEDAMFYNPGAIASGNGLYKKTVIPSLGLQFSQSTKDIIKQISLQDEEATDALRNAIGVPQHLGLNAFTGLILRRAAVGVYLNSTNTILIAKDPDEGAVEKASLESSTTTGLAFSFAQDFLGNQGVGVTTRVIKKAQASASFIATDASQVQDSDSFAMTGSALAFDLGYLFKYKGSTNFNLGATIENFLGTAYTPDENTTLAKEYWPLKDDPMTVNLGLSVEKIARLSSFKFLLDYRDILNETGHTAMKRLHMGTEISVDGYLGITAGLNQGYPTIGTYMDIRLFRVDVGMYTEEIGDRAGERGDKRMFIRFLAGF